MSEMVTESLEDLFREYFPAWTSRIKHVEHKSPDCIQVEIEKKGICLFGRKEDGSIFFQQGVTAQDVQSNSQILQTA